MTTALSSELRHNCLVEIARPIWPGHPAAWLATVEWSDRTRAVSVIGYAGRASKLVDFTRAGYPIATLSLLTGGLLGCMTMP